MKVFFDFELASDVPQPVNTLRATRIREEIRSYVYQRFSVLNDEAKPFDKDGACIVLQLSMPQRFIEISGFSKDLTEKIKSNWTQIDEDFLNLRIREIDQSFDN